MLELWDEVPTAEELSGVALPSVLAWAAELAGQSDGASARTSARVSEARRLYPSVVVLESLAVRQSPPFDGAALEALRAANERFRAAAGDPAAAIAADDDFHRALTAGCGNEHLLAALDPVRRALLRYERVYMREPARIERSVAQHEGDHRGARARRPRRGRPARAREPLCAACPSSREALER